VARAYWVWYSTACSTAENLDMVGIPIMLTPIIILPIITILKKMRRRMRKR